MSVSANTPCHGPGSPHVCYDHLLARVQEAKTFNELVEVGRVAAGHLACWSPERRESFKDAFTRRGQAGERLFQLGWWD